VLNDFRLLATLPNREKFAGFAEAVKVACIRDSSFFENLELIAPSLRQFEPRAVKKLIRSCAELHVDHIATSGDPFEFGSARPLDFGHWAAHKLEQLSDFKIGHGAAVAIGIALDVVYCKRIGYLGRHSTERILSLLEELGFELFAPELAMPGKRYQLQVLAGLEEFREHLGGQLSLTLLRGIGEAFEVHEVNPLRVVDAVHELLNRRAARRLTELVAAF
jgi:3-dehydroquinate synthase